jgi:hypothetical protein
MSAHVRKAVSVEQGAHFGFVPNPDVRQTAAALSDGLRFSNLIEGCGM